jgi:hypothetical protein
MIEPSKALVALPHGLREALLRSYREIANNFSERRWEPSELNGGKFSEVVYTIIHGALSGTFPSKPSKPTDMLKACRSLEGLPTNPSRVGDRSLRILIPRILIALYETRNNRGVGHVGGDVDPNFLDATAVYGMASWTLAELVRVYHDISTQEAQQTVDTLVERKHPLLWNIEGVNRVLDPKMRRADQTLFLLHARRAWISEKELLESIEYSDANMFRRNVLKPLHKKRLVEYDERHGRVHISPNGSKEVEVRILATRS